MSVEHIVIMQFKPDATEEDEAAVMDAVLRLEEHIDGVERVVGDKSFTDRAGPYTHGIIVTLKDRDALAEYGDHPAHQAALKVIRAHVDNYLVIDFEHDRT